MFLIFWQIVVHKILALNPTPLVVHGLRYVSGFSVGK